ncbi:hypothetical protein [Paenibacillus sp. MMO-177]|uniref:hypothetical protein n=1 Tax=Paenibacillus sp. MMO-177 TaxID=3081289 RepID=UPI003018530A
MNISSNTSHVILMAFDDRREAINNHLEAAKEHWNSLMELNYAMDSQMVKDAASSIEYWEQAREELREAVSEYTQWQIRGLG